MRILRQMSDWPRGERCGALAIGVFDGVHIGHQAVIAELVARSGDLPAAVMTFEPHPLVGLGKEPPPFLTSFSQKCDLLASLGVDVVFAVPFTPEYARTGHDQFADQIASLLSPDWVVVGEHFRFGAGGKGDLAALTRRGEIDGFRVSGIPDVCMDDTVASSTAIRQMIQTGDLHRAKRLLGRYYAVRGCVIKGDGRGRTLGFPTANIQPPVGQALPPDGVYATRVSVKGTRHPGVLNLGQRPTFGPGLASIEAHIIGFSDDVYGETLDVEFIEYLRPEKRFSDVVGLISQVTQDVSRALAILAR